MTGSVVKDEAVNALNKVKIGKVAGTAHILVKACKALGEEGVDLYLWVLMRKAYTQE